ncbi:adenylyl-sulfate kinase [Rossellomorea vietnamensis]|uniref:adenylyl-sulfate kinase n=1 Tax=Rossellomorea vietnamensis TaxID=218284 RepID=UPI003CEE34FB
MKSENTVWHNGGISKEKRQNRNGHKSMIIWLTGLSGSGKSTLSVELEKRLFESGRQVYRLDGDNLRHGLNSNLGFSEKDRNENIRRVGETAKLFVDAGTIVLTAFISPYQKDREWVKSLVEKGEFIEVYMNASLEECEKRDPKGLYRKARAGEIKGFTGIDAPYETPLSPALVIDTETETVEQSAEKVLAYLRERKYI